MNDDSDTKKKAESMARLLVQGATAEEARRVAEMTDVAELYPGESLMEQPMNALKRANHILYYGQVDPPKPGEVGAVTIFRSVVVAGVTIARSETTGEVKPFGFATFDGDRSMPLCMDKMAEKLEEVAADIRKMAALARERARPVGSA
jgi:hypothetical protein